MQPIIQYTLEPSGQCPVQAEGFINGLPFYFRSRHTCWSIDIAIPPNTDPVGGSERLIYVEDYKGHAYVEGEDNTHAAGWADKEECKEFVERAANIMASWSKT